MTSSLRRMQVLIDSVSGNNAKAGPLVVNNCKQCKFRREVPGNCHIACDNPDTDMTGDPHGIKQGWFMYPLLFDPTWMTSECKNFEQVSRVCQSSGEPK